MPQPVAADKTALSVGEIARRCDIPVSTVHFYEAEGLIRSWRNNGNHRRYSRHVLRRIAVIKVAQRTGITLRELVDGLSALGLGPRDLISILQSIKTAGALQADIEVM